jgi:hypothetical protein
LTVASSFKGNKNDWKISKLVRNRKINWYNC